MFGLKLDKATFHAGLQDGGGVGVEGRGGRRRRRSGSEKVMLSVGENNWRRQGRRNR